MNKDNADYLKERLFFLGFGDKLNEELEKKMKAGEERFKLPITAEFTKGDKKEIVEYSLDFSKSKQNDMYFLNNYRAILANAEPDKEKSQTFYVNKGKGVTAKEAYNLLDGRAVHKDLTNREGEPYKAWLQLTGPKDENGNQKIQQFHSAWGYNVEKSLHKHPIKELGDQISTAELVKSMEKGNLQPVTFKKDGNEVKMYVEANPRERNVNVYNEKMQKQFQGVKEHTGESKSKGKDTVQDDEKEKKEKVDDVDARESKTKGRKMSA
ncbi:MAG TPA: hypothetical protein VIN08_04025 [Ohtaekwangia sp.]|uniref:hypothetical protein n=1 Tax=Ohtaekwangia sp. TaxID=2066019 RepID=UPI002F93FD73